MNKIKKMKNININTVKGITALKEEMVKVFDKHTKELKLKESLESLNDANFFELKKLFESVSDKLYDTPTGKKCIKEYINCITKDNNMKSMLCLYEAMIKPQNISNSEIFVNESIDLGRNTIKGKVNCSKLSEIVKKSLKEAKVSSEDIKDILSKKDEFTNALLYILENKKQFNNLSEYTTNLNILCEHVKANNVIKENIETIDITKSLSDLNESIDESLSLFERNAIRDITLVILSGNGKDTLFEDYKAKCIDKIDESILGESNIESKSRLDNMKQTLLEQTYNEDTLNDDILRFARILNTFEE